MNGAHLHVAVNHFPVAGVLGATLFLLLSRLCNRDFFLRMALVLFLAAGILALPAYFSGEGAEEVVQALPTTLDLLVAAHETAAQAALAALLVLGLLGGGGLWVLKKRGSLPAWFVILLLVAGIFACAVAGRTAYLGGLIGHPELR